MEVAWKRCGSCAEAQSILWAGVLEPDRNKRYGPIENTIDKERMMEERDEKKGRKEMEEGNEKEIKEENDGQRQKAIDCVTIGGSMVNGVLLVFKFVAGVLGGSAAMIADAVHSLSDFVTDLVAVSYTHLTLPTNSRV